MKATALYVKGTKLTLKLVKFIQTKPNVCSFFYNLLKLSAVIQTKKRAY